MGVLISTIMIFSFFNYTSGSLPNRIFSVIVGGTNSSEKKERCSSKAVLSFTLNLRDNLIPV